VIALLNNSSGSRISSSILTWPNTLCGHATANTVTYAILAPPDRTGIPTEVVEMTRAVTPVEVAETAHVIVIGVRGVVIVEVTKVT